MKIFNEYFLGGIDVLHEQFVDQCTDDDSYLRRIFDFVKIIYIYFYILI